MHARCVWRSRGIADALVVSSFTSIDAEKFVPQRLLDRSEMPHRHHGVSYALTRIRRALSLALLVTQAVLAQPAPQSAPTCRDPSHDVRWITVDSSVRLEVLDWGGSGPPLVLLGCYLTAHVHDEFAPKLTNQFHVYGMTRRGIGASDKPTTGYTVPRSATDVLEVLDSLNQQKSLLGGTSCAGQILTVFASQHSDRLRGLVYIDGAGDPTTPAYASGALLTWLGEV